jgi:plastocyanin domain-containing protein
MSKPWSFLLTVVVSGGLLASAALVDGAHATPSIADALRLDIAITPRGFEPDNITVPAGKPVTLVFLRKTEKTCTKEVIISLDDGKKIERKLPLNVPVEIVVTFPKAGTLTYACSMNMAKGKIVVQ